MGVQFDKRTGLRILNAVKQVEGGSPHYTRRPMNPKRPGGGGGGSSPSMIMAFVYCETPPDAPGGTFSVPNPWIYTPPDDPDPASWDLSGDWLVMDGSLTHLQVLDEEDEPVLLDVADPLFKVPTTGDYCLIVGPAGASTFQLIDRRCGGGGPIP